MNSRRFTNPSCLTSDHLITTLSHLTDSLIIINDLPFFSAMMNLIQFYLLDTKIHFPGLFLCGFMIDLIGAVLI